MVKAALPPVVQMPALRRSTRNTFPLLKRVTLAAAIFVTVHTVNTWLFYDDHGDTNEEDIAAIDWTKIKADVQEDPSTYISEGFLGSPRSKLIKVPASDGSISAGKKTCECDLVSVDCLDSIDCILSDVNDDDNDINAKVCAYDQVYAGIVKRRVLKDSLDKVWDKPFRDWYDWAPLGKTLQSLSIKVWREWLSNNQLPKGMLGKQEGFVNASAYPYCVEHGLQGKACFFGDFDATEAYGQLEMEAKRKHELKSSKLRALSDPQMEVKLKQELRYMREHTPKLSPLEYLIGFAHLSKVTFHLRQHVMDIYEIRLRTVESIIGSVDDGGNNILRVALHVRRGDACSHETRGYKKRPCRLDSPAQLSGLRKCYDTTVYMDALERVQKLAGSNRHMVVHVATDHMLSLMDEIKENHKRVYDSMTWKFVDYPRQMFNYSVGLTAGSEYIEWAPNKAALGETALIDIHHLSHGQVFVGHLGSRFGKLSWWQAIARHNAFVPFFTVDGHSVCCDIDEACGTVAPAIVSMENCLTYSRDDGPYINDGESYWKVGGTVRFQAAADEIGGLGTADKIRKREEELRAAADVVDGERDFSKVPPALTKTLLEIIQTGSIQK